MAVTSLPVFESRSPNYRKLPARQLEMLSADARADYERVFALTGKGQSRAGRARRADVEERA